MRGEESAKYGIGEWYGRPIEKIPSADRSRYAKVKGKNKEPCPFHLDGAMCNKAAGVYSLALHSCRGDRKGEHDGTQG